MHCLWLPRWVPANQQSVRKIKEMKRFGEGQNYFSAFLFSTEDEGQTACPGIIRPHQGRWASVQEWGVKGKGKGTWQRKVPAITEKRCEFWKKEASQQNMWFTFQNRHLENWVLGGCPVSLSFAIGLTLVLWDPWLGALPKGGGRWAPGSCQGTKACFSHRTKPELRNSCVVCMDGDLLMEVSSSIGSQWDDCVSWWEKYSRP